MFCRNCGAVLEDENTVCPRCGTVNNSYSENVQQTTAQTIPPVAPVQQQNDDEKSFGFAFLSFIFPLLGLILFLCWKKETPLRAKSCLHGMIAGIVTSVVVTILFFVLTSLLFFAGIGAMTC